MGYTGVTGSTGYTGETGSTGYTGVTGSTGYTGETGSTGYTGSTGSIGPTGISGYTTTLTPSNIGIIPTMTSATTSGFTISASREFSLLFPAWKACDGNITTAWAMNGSTFPFYWTVQCPTQYVIWKIEISKREGGSEWIDTFYFEGSNDNANWKTLVYSTGQVSTIGLPPSILTLLINDSTYTSYSYFRVRCTAATGPNPGFVYFQMYAYTNTTAPYIGPTGPSPTTITSLTLTQGSNINLSNITTTLDNCNVSDGYSFYGLVSASTSVNITGFTGGVIGRILIIINNSGYQQTFQEEKQTSTDINRLSLGIPDKTIGTNKTITFIYSSVSVGNRWIMISST